MWRSIQQWFASWFTVESPLTEEQRAWIDGRFEWLRNAFGDGPLHVPTVTPSDDHFPERYTASPEDAERLLSRLCEHMSVDRNRLDFQLYISENADDVVAAFRSSRAHQGYALGVFEQTESRINIWLEGSRLNDATTVVSTLAHELGHVLLLADGRCSHEAPDHEPLTDLLTVFFGLGIFTANSTIRSVNWRYGNWEGWSIARQGYLTMPEVAYALALYCHARGEMPPAWQRFLRSDMRALLRYELGRLQIEPSEQANMPADDDAIDSTEHSPEEPVNSTAEAVDDEHDLSHGDDLFSQAEFQASQGNYAEALELYTQSLIKQPDDWEASRQRAVMQLTLNQYQEAIEDATCSIKLGDSGCESYVIRSRAYIALQEYPLALDDAQRAIQIDSRVADGFQVRGLARLGLGKQTEALYDLNRAIELSPLWSSCYLIRGQLHQQLGNVRRAEKDLQEALQLDERIADPAYRQLAFSWMSPLVDLS